MGLGNIIFGRCNLKAHLVMDDIVHGLFHILGVLGILLFEHSFALDATAAGVTLGRRPFSLLGVEGGGGRHHVALLNHFDLKRAHVRVLVRHNLILRVRVVGIVADDLHLHPVIRLQLWIVKRLPVLHVLALKLARVLVVDHALQLQQITGLDEVVEALLPDSNLT